MINNKLLCYSTIGILFVLIFMIGIKVFKNKTIIEENFYGGEVPTDQDTKIKLTELQRQIDEIKSKNISQDELDRQIQNTQARIEPELEKLKLFENIDLTDLDSTNQNIDLYKNALLETDTLRKQKDEEQLRSIKENQDAVNDMKNSALEISNLETNLNSIYSQLGTFHDTYNQNLERILNEKLNIDETVFKQKKNELNQKISDLEKLVDDIDEDDSDKQILQIENHKTSTRLAVQLISNIGSSGTDVKIYHVYVNTPENNPGCLSIDDAVSTPKGVFCEKGSNQQKFILKKINKESEYRSELKAADKDNIANQSIKYPFYIVKPELSTSMAGLSDLCLFCNIDKGLTKLSFRPVTGSMNERFSGFTNIDHDLETCNM